MGAPINKLFSEIEINREGYIIERAIHFLIEMALKADNVESGVQGT